MKEIFQENEVLNKALAPWVKREDFAFYAAILSHQFNYVFQHSQRVAYYAVMLAEKIGCNAVEISNIGAAAILHDIGKINVPIKVLYKQGVYNKQEMAEMQRHCIYGYQILLRSKELRELAVDVLCHHEHYDGNGYPKGLKWQAVPLAARIIQIAEAFDVMTTVQNYQHLKTGAQAIAELERLAGSQFDEDLVRIFKEINPGVAVANESIAIALTSSKKLYQALAANGVVKYMNNIENLGIICLDKNNTVVFCNPYAETIRQLPVGSLLGKNFLDSYPQHRRKIIAGKLSQLRNLEKKEWYRLMGRDGKFIENRYSSVVDEQGNFVGTVLVTIDVTEREQVARSLSAALERQAALYQAAQIITSALSIEEVTEGILRIIKRAVVVRQANICLFEGKMPATVMADEGAGVSLNMMMVEETSHYAAERLRNTLRTVTINDEKNRLVTSHIPIIYRTELLGILVVERDWQEAEAKERLELLEALASQTAVAIRNAKLHEAVTYLAEYDNLTGLLNRHSFNRIFTEYCGKNKTQATVFTVIMIDINGLKPVNDHYGHVAGDLLIKAAAQVVKTSIRKDDRAFRYGGDEIVVLMPGVTLDQAYIIIKRIQRNAKWWKSKGAYADLALSLSIGAAASNEVEAAELIQEADKRMYENKRTHYQLITT